jgi:hypothetical protein
MQPRDFGDVRHWQLQPHARIDEKIFWHDSVVRITPAENGNFSIYSITLASGQSNDSSLFPIPK